MVRPKLRRVRGFPMPVQNQQGQRGVMLGIADAQQISPKVVVTQPAVQMILPRMDGTKALDQIVSEVGRGLTTEFMQQLVAQLDDAGLIEGPVFRQMRDKMRADFDASENLPPGATAQFADILVVQEFGKETTEDQKAEHGPRKLREQFDKWIDEALKNAEKPAFDELPKAVVAPHLDYPRGWLNYAHVYGRLRVADRPDRIVVLGTNHFGESTGVVACNKGYETPLGIVPCATDLLGKLREHLGADLGEKLLEHRFDHEREHSIELHVPWIQHCIGADDAGNPCPVLGVLVHDPSVNNGESYDGNGVALEPFVAALKAAIADLPGRTLVVASTDLSHVGPAFGDQRKLLGDEPDAKEFREGTVRHDQEMLKMVVENRPEELVGSMAWQQNPTRWCSIGNLVATLQVVEPESVELLNYMAAVDQQGAGMVSSVAMVMR